MERIEGFSRAELYNLSGQGLIRSKAIVKKGAKKGIRLFHVQSIRDYIDGLPEGLPTR